MSHFSGRLSPTRSLALSGAGGASYYEPATGLEPETGAPTELRGHWTPSGRASIRLDLARSWALNADYSRTTAVLNRITVETFHSDALYVRLGGLINPRLDATFSGGFTRGNAAGVNDQGRYDSYTATAQLRYALSRTWATFVSYTYYDYGLQQIQTSERLPDQETQNRVRVGLTFQVPLVTPSRATPPLTPR